MNTVNVKGLKILACHGVNDSEKVQPQPFIFNVEAHTDFYLAAKEDDLNGTVNYSSVCKLITAIATQNCFNLIETLAYRCAFKIMQTFPQVAAVTVTVEKPQAPVKADFDTVSVSVKLKRVQVVLALGSSMGDKKAYLDYAVTALNNTQGVTVKKVSSYMQSAPYGGVAQNSFLNACLLAETFLAPHNLLREIHRIEGECNRVRDTRWGDRTLDIDIIFYGNEIIYSDDLIIPHPDYLNRAFVLTPLKEVAPDFVCPLKNMRVREI